MGLGDRGTSRETAACCSLMQPASPNPASSSVHSDTDPHRSSLVSPSSKAMVCWKPRGAASVGAGMKPLLAPAHRSRVRCFLSSPFFSFTHLFPWLGGHLDSHPHLKSSLHSYRPQT